MEEEGRNLLSAQDLAGKTRGLELAAIATGPGFVTREEPKIATSPAPRATNTFSLN